jgi:glutamyl-tRNA synthetase
MFDTQKLEWMNNHYIQTLDDDDLAARCLHFLSVAGLTPELGLLRRAMPLVRERMKTLAESVELLTFLFTDDLEPNEKARALIEKAGAEYLRKAADALAKVEPWTAEAIQETLDAVSQEAGLNRTKGWQPIRAAATGSNVSPPLPESLELLGRERAVVRIRAAAIT